MLGHATLHGMNATRRLRPPRPPTQVCHVHFLFVCLLHIALCDALIFGHVISSERSFKIPTGYPAQILYRRIWYHDDILSGFAVTVTLHQLKC